MFRMNIQRHERTLTARFGITALISHSLACTKNHEGFFSGY